VLVFRMDGHVAVVNSRAFEISGVDEGTSDLVQGRFDGILRPDD
jgi:predicted amidohydrolase YtcJ